jgi:hypothetical protein
MSALEGGLLEFSFHLMLLKRLANDGENLQLLVLDLHISNMLMKTIREPVPVFRLPRNVN